MQYYIVLPNYKSIALESQPLKNKRTGRLINSNAKVLIAMQKIIIVRKLSFNFLNQAEINKSSKMERVNSLMANVTWKYNAF